MLDYIMFCVNILQEEKGSAFVYSDFAAILSIYLLPIRDTFD